MGHEQSFSILRQFCEEILAQPRIINSETKWFGFLTKNFPNRYTEIQRLATSRDGRKFLMTCFRFLEKEELKRNISESRKDHLIEQGCYLRMMLNNNKQGTRTNFKCETKWELPCSRESFDHYGTLIITDGIYSAGTLLNTSIGSYKGITLAKLISLIQFGEIEEKDLAKLHKHADEKEILFSEKSGMYLHKCSTCGTNCYSNFNGKVKIAVGFQDGFSVTTNHTKSAPPKLSKEELITRATEALRIRYPEATQLRFIQVLTIQSNFKLPPIITKLNKNANQINDILKPQTGHINDPTLLHNVGNTIKNNEIIVDGRYSEHLLKETFFNDIPALHRVQTGLKRTILNTQIEATQEEEKPIKKRRWFSPED